MALIDESTQFSPDDLENPVIGIAARVGRHDSGLHQHQKGQLLYAPQGCMTITLAEVQCVLPPTRAAWIPANTLHCARMNNVVEYRSLYLSEQYANIGGDDVSIIEVTPLLRELIERMSFWAWDKPSHEMTNTLNLFIEELQQAKPQTLFLPLPKDARLQTWLDELQAIDTPSNAPSLSQLSQRIAASSKTISRIFSRETGMPYQAWRQQWRLLKSIEYLSQGLTVADVAHQLAFSSDSAFIAFFKQQTGQTPYQYINQ
ncbi:AraC family transcriptional regulator [Vibrio ponticus]|uniref:AraC family transcriptional regulator n=1 Tax=Vibrio ponticus TaxID=265668 RepID=A0A3N3DUG2_9VIBR|nr:helix-turn-helix transcriptional regulator [Vibrio ponticus]ROV58123.1 AraC family transcriptional regulator [Vibrio ponticus]